MKFERDSEMTKIAIYTFFVLAAAILFYLFVQKIGFLFAWAEQMLGFLLPVVYGFSIAYLLNPMVHYFDDKVLPRVFKRLRRSTKRGISILLTYLITSVFISLFAALVVPQVVRSLVAIGGNIPSYMKYLQTLYLRFSDMLQDLEFLDDNTVQQLVSSVVQSFEAILGRLGDWLTGDFVSRLWNMASRLTTGIFDFILGIILSIYFLIDREKLVAQLNKVCTALFSDRTLGYLKEITADMDRVFSGFILGKILDSLAVGTLCFIGMSLLGLPYALLISVILGVTNVIPYFGPIIGAIPGILLVFISSPTKGPMQALIFLVFVLVLMQFDGNILEPKILGDSTGLSSFWVIVSILMFNGFFGILGMFIGVPCFAVFYNLAKRTAAYILRKKGKSVHTRDYASEQNPLLK